MGKGKQLSRKVFLAIGIIVGLIIFLLGSQLTANMKHAEKQDFKNEQPKEPNPLVKKLFS